MQPSSTCTLADLLNMSPLAHAGIMECARAQEQAGDTDNAIELLRCAATLNPYCASTWIELVRVLRASGKLELASAYEEIAQTVEAIDDL